MIAAAVSGVGHQLVIELVTQVHREEDKQRLVAVIRERQAYLRDDVVGCLVLKALDGWM